MDKSEIFPHSPHRTIWTTGINQRFTPVAHITTAISLREMYLLMYIQKYYGGIERENLKTDSRLSVRTWEYQDRQYRNAYGNYRVRYRAYISG